MTNEEARVYNVKDKKCTKCKKIKPHSTDFFYYNKAKPVYDIPAGWGYQCKDCVGSRCPRRLYAKARWEKVNREKRLVCRRAWNHSEKGMAWTRKYKNDKRKNDPVFKYKQAFRSRARAFYKSKGKKKNTKSEKLLGCTWQELRDHLESQFQPGMTHENHGNGWGEKREWHIDHIRPLDSFDLDDPKDEAAANHYTNLQPLWARDNISKRNKWDD